MLAVYERPGACHSLQCHRKAIHLSWTRSCSISLLWFCCSLAWISADRSAPRIINIWGHVNRDCSGTLNHEKKITFFFTLFHKRYYSKEEKKKEKREKERKIYHECCDPLIQQNDPEEQMGHSKMFVPGSKKNGSFLPNYYNQTSRCIHLNILLHPPLAPIAYYSPGE